MYRIVEASSRCVELWKLAHNVWNCVGMAKYRRVGKDRKPT